MFFFSFGLALAIGSLGVENAGIREHALFVYVLVARDGGGMARSRCIPFAAYRRRCIPTDPTVNVRERLYVGTAK